MEKVGADTERDRLARARQHWLEDPRIEAGIKQQMLKIDPTDARPRDLQRLAAMIRRCERSRSPGKQFEPMPDFRTPGQIRRIQSSDR